MMMEAFPKLPTLVLWRDPVARSGAECMAIDELLLDMEDVSVLRVYHWGNPTVTYGYFDQPEEAKRIFPDEGIEFVRRWTGGGIVDHREDIPFTLALNASVIPVRPTSALLYCWIHGALAKSMLHFNIPSQLLVEDAPSLGRACFVSPVTSDLVNPAGEKLAGGGQRRAKTGVLHQGSIQHCALPEGWDEHFARQLTENLVISEAEEVFSGIREASLVLARQKYPVS